MDLIAGAIDGIGQPTVSVASLLVAAYVVVKATRNRTNRPLAYVLFAISAFLAFQSLSYIDILPIETAHAVAFAARLTLLGGVVVFAFRLRQVNA